MQIDLNRNPIRQWFTASALALSAALPAVAQPTAPLDPRGRWVTAAGTLEVEIAPCGKALCGDVARVLANRAMSPQGNVETQPTAPAEKLVGLRVLKDLVPAGQDAAGRPNAWTGEVFNRDNGKTYRCQVTVSTEFSPDGELVLVAYETTPAQGRTQRWQRSVAR